MSKTLQYLERMVNDCNRSIEAKRLDLEKTTAKLEAFIDAKLMLEDELERLGK